MKTINRKRIQSALMFLFLASLLATARGELLFSESFDYPAGSLVGDGPPPGAPEGQGSWLLANHKARVTPSGLQFPGIPSEGNAAGLRGSRHATGDSVAANFSGVTPVTGVAWIGFLMNRIHKSPFSDGFAVVTLGNIADGPVPGVGLLFWMNEYGIDNDTGEEGAQAGLGITPSEDAVWLVTKLDFTTGDEYVWASPSPLTEPDINTAGAHLPMTSYFLSNGFSSMEMRAGFTTSAFQFDELRIGTDYFDLVGLGAD